MEKMIFPPPPLVGAEFFVSAPSVPAGLWLKADLAFSLGVPAGLWLKADLAFE